MLYRIKSSPGFHCRINITLFGCLKIKFHLLLAHLNTFRVNDGLIHCDKFQCNLAVCGLVAIRSILTGNGHMLYLRCCSGELLIKIRIPLLIICIDDVLDPCRIVSTIRIILCFHFQLMLKASLRSNL